MRNSCHYGRGVGTEESESSLSLETGSPRQSQSEEGGPRQSDTVLRHHLASAVLQPKGMRNNPLEDCNQAMPSRVETGDRQQGPELWNIEAEGSTMLGMLPGDNH
jgi:hypothetical protein